MERAGLHAASSKRRNTCRLPLRKAVGSGEFLGAGNTHCRVVTCLERHRPSCAEATSAAGRTIIMATVPALKVCRNSCRTRSSTSACRGQPSHKGAEEAGATARRRHACGRWL